MQLGLSQKGKIFREGYVYFFKNELANNIPSFECELRRKGQCRARIKVDDGDQIVDQINEHTHPPSQTKCEMERVKNRSQTTFDTTQNSYRALRNISNCSSKSAECRTFKAHNSLTKRRCWKIVASKINKKIKITKIMCITYEI